jgi:hypothetical protein
MKRIVLIGIATMALGSVGLAPQAAFAAKKDPYAHKSAECKQEAKSKHFGIHLIKRDRWIKNCIAGRRT